MGSGEGDVFVVAGLPSRRLRTGIAVALAGPVAVVLIDLAVPGLSIHPLILLSIPVVVAAWLGGLWPALLATATSTVTVALRVWHAGRGMEELAAIPLIAFVVQGVVVSAIVEALHRARNVLARQGQELRRAHEQLAARATREIATQHAGRERAEQALRSTEEQLRQAQKMEAVGRLAGGVAHDFNNLVSIILSYCEMDMARLPEGDRLRGDLQEILDAGKRAAALTRQLLAFSRHQVLQPRVVDLGELVAGMESMIRRVVGESIEVRVCLASGPGRVKCDRGQMEQVLLNLVINARDAMPDGGRLTIETANVTLDETYAAQHLGARAGPHVMLAVSDTGHGMDAATRARIFDPFFTTKGPGKGTGLGLSTVYGTVNQSGGAIWVYSEVGKGTTFKVYMPRTDEREAVEPRPAARKDSHGGNETVLLVEDEEQLRVLASRILEGAGYRVIVAPSGQAAIEACERGERFHLLLTDVVMPGMSGSQLAQRLSATAPDARVLFMSGYTDNVIVHHGVLDAGIALLEKPLTPGATLAKVREVLDAPPPRYALSDVARPTHR